jgi:hypothetical protein
MNVTTVNTDGICVYIHTKVHPSKAMKILVKTSIIASIIGIMLLNVTDTNTAWYPLGLILLFGSIVCTLPMIRTILWNLYGEETISVSTKAIVSQVSYGLFQLNPQTHTYGGNRLLFNIETLLETDGIKSGLLHFYSYDANNQSYHLFRNVGYITEEKCHDIIRNIELIFTRNNSLLPEVFAN